MNAHATSTAELARLNWRLGLAYAEAVQATLALHPTTIDLVGCHGQTVFHQPVAEEYAGAGFACTWQLGESAGIAAALGVPVVSNFRPADMVAGGQGAPLVCLLDWALFADPKRGRVLQNLGGIGNLTAIPAGAALDQIVAFDTGPGNMVIDGLMTELFGEVMDRDGQAAERGRAIAPALAWALGHEFFGRMPPKTAGREQFGREFATALLKECRKHSSEPEDAVATATELTAQSIALAYARFVRSAMGTGPVDYIVSGGGARNRALLGRLQNSLRPLGCAVVASDRLGMPAEAKEAAAFALLAWRTWFGLPSNAPSATGARRPAILGQVTYV